MTTAHRPTFHAAIGGKEQGGGRYIAGVSRTHVHDLASQMSIKSRGKAAKRGDKNDLRGSLEAKELEHLQALGKAPARAAIAAPPLPPPDDSDDEEDAPGLLIDPGDADDRVAGKGRGAPAEAAPADEASEEEEESDDDADDEEELMRELERIKKERAAESARKQREEASVAAAESDSSIVQANPLLDPTGQGGSSAAVKRRWDDDVVFKNQSREPKKEARRFINDTVRNDFHKRFLNKYVR